MDALIFGSLSIEDAEEGIRIVPVDASPATIKTAEVPLLLNFLKQHLEESANRRSSWRLPLSTLGGTRAEQLVVSLQRGGHEIDVGVIDLSITGSLVSTGHYVGESGDKVAVHLVLEDLEATLTGTIVRQDHDRQRVAIHFPDCIDEAGALTPPEAYREIFNALEEIWLDKKLGLVWS